MADDKLVTELVLSLDIAASPNFEKVYYFLEHLPIVSLILYQDGYDERSFQKAVEKWVPQVQQKNVAVLIADHSQIAARTKADGVHFSGSLPALKSLREALAQDAILGYGGAHNRHDAMEAGECGADYIFFGKLGKDKMPHCLPRNLSLASWWAEMMQIPVVVQAGASLESFKEAKATGAEFIAVETLLFGANDQKTIVKQIKEVLAFEG